MKKWIIIIAVVGVVGWAVSDFVISNNAKKDSVSETEVDNPALEADGATGLEDGDQAPDFELETVEGETVRLSDLQGEKVLLNFWATWCPPCRAEMPDMQKLHEEEHDFVILAVNLTETEQSFEDVEDFLEEFGITFQILIDETTEVSSEYNAFALPTSYFINTDGTIHRKTIGTLNYDLILELIEEMD